MQRCGKALLLAGQAGAALSGAQQQQRVTLQAAAALLTTSSSGAKASSAVHAQPHVPPAAQGQPGPGAATGPSGSRGSTVALPHFDDHQAAFAGQPTSYLLRALMVFRICAIPAFVKNSETLLKTSQAVLGQTATTALIRHTFFKHFCAGEDSTEVEATVKRLASRNVGAILDYAAEDDVSQQKPSQPAPAGPGSSSATSSSAASKPATDASMAGTAAQGPADAKPEATVSGQTGRPSIVASKVVARQYDYQNEEQCDRHVGIFKHSIHMASLAKPMQGFAAVKLTGLGNPMLLERISLAIREVRGLFKTWDSDASGFIERAEFERAYSSMLPDASAEEKARVFAWMDTQASGRVDYVSWCQRLRLDLLPELAARIREQGRGRRDDGPAWRTSLSGVALTEQEIALVNAMRARLHALAEEAVAKDVKVMVDAEHTYFQPAIDHLTHELARQYNAGGTAYIYNTYQAYLTDCLPRLQDDLERARRQGYKLGAKLVRGAYLQLERRRAQAMGYDSPVWAELQQTHDCYNACMKVLLQAVAEGRAEVLLGTHNQGSVEGAVAEMARLGLEPRSSPVYFGQLLGMSDHLTQVLGSAGYKAYKYVPFGKVEQVVPYLLRRATENAYILKGAKRDVHLLEAELGHRLKQRVSGLFSASR